MTFEFPASDTNLSAVVMKKNKQQKQKAKAENKTCPIFLNSNFQKTGEESIKYLLLQLFKV